MNELRGMSEQFEQLRNKCRKNIEEMMEENSRRWFCFMRVNKLSAAYGVKKNTTPTNTSKGKGMHILNTKMFFKYKYILINTTET